MTTIMRVWIAKTTSLKLSHFISGKGVKSEVLTKKAIILLGFDGYLRSLQESVEGKAILHKGNHVPKGTEA